MKLAYIAVKGSHNSSTIILWVITTRTYLATFIMFSKN